MKCGDIILLKGNLGVGKTFVSKQIIKNLTGKDLASSPTFNIVHTHKVNKKIEIWHCDFYRLKEFDEIAELGVFDEVNKKIIIVEWPKFLDQFNLHSLCLEIEFGKEESERIFKILFSKNWEDRIKLLKV